MTPIATVIPILAHLPLEQVNATNILATLYGVALLLEGVSCKQHDPKTTAADLKLAYHLHYSYKVSSSKLQVG